jgi:hypothetical protein
MFLSLLRTLSIEFKNDPRANVSVFAETFSIFAKNVSVFADNVSAAVYARRGEIRSTSSRVKIETMTKIIIFSKKLNSHTTHKVVHDELEVLCDSSKFEL